LQVPRKIVIRVARFQYSKGFKVVRPYGASDVIINPSQFRARHTRPKPFLQRGLGAAVGKSLAALPTLHGGKVSNSIPQSRQDTLIRLRPKKPAVVSSSYDEKPRAMLRNPIFICSEYARRRVVA
jgi:hypothetical protein